MEMDKVNPAAASHPLPASPFSSQSQQGGRSYLVQTQAFPHVLKILVPQLYFKAHDNFKVTE